ncbi:HAD-like domain-containing protein [Catenaria anguillulae PL171]|uniref:HAD-like domain-containing protein n=1 Tax=Catenaria anguillulae PL171 TaxID=765915 RepID=A0A1Y2HL90_9FUNG|nr:HAD-like domain-containing protein [Catenaria anguillulae PL171]
MTSSTPDPSTLPATAVTSAADGFNGLAASTHSTLAPAATQDAGRPLNNLQPYRLVLLDIEGTTTDIAFVHDTLFPYARQHLAPLIRAHLASPPKEQDPQVQSAIDLLHSSGAISDPTDADEILAHLHALMDSDTKSTALKQLQGLLWDKAYKRGDIAAHIYSDVLPMLYYYQALKVPVAIYSSGSIHAQKLLFAYSQFGDLTSLLSGVYFDTTTGPKLVAESYVKIVDALKSRALVQHASDVLFVSDNPNELVAAKHAGVQVVLADRPGNPLVTDDARHEYPVMQVFSQLKRKRVEVDQDMNQQDEEEAAVKKAKTE